MRDLGQPMRRWIARSVISRITSHLVMIGVLCLSATMGWLGIGGAFGSTLDSLSAASPARASVANSELQAAEFELRAQAPNSSDPMDALHVEPSAAPTPVGAIPLKPPPKPSVRNWSGPTGYVEGDGSLAWPVGGDGGYISQYFWSGHLGIDIAIAYGTPALAADAGTVVWAGSRGYSGGGLVVEIEHANGITTYYLHLSVIRVTAGDVVVRGQQIGDVGCTGICTGPHLMFEVKIGGVYVNPLRYL